MAEQLKQWKVVWSDYRETFDNEPEARRAYGKCRNAIREDEEGRCELYGRSSITSQWTLLQEFQIGIEEEEEEEEE